MPTSEEIITFSKTIEKYAMEKRMGIMDAIVDYCEKNEIEIETASTLLSDIIKQKIRVEAQELNLLVKANTLPL